MRFEWDEEKDLLNYRKHGVWFEEAQTIWADAGAVEFLDPDHGAEETRYLRIGYSTRARLLLVVFCERGDVDVVRLISARRATRLETRTYEEGI